MNTRRFVAAGISAALVIATGGAVLNLLPTPAHGQDASASVLRPVHTPSASGAAGGHAGHPGKRVTTEVLPPTAKSSVPVLPRSKPLQPLFAGPVPKAAGVRGKLVSGFPANLPVVAESLIKTSSVSSSDGRMQVTLDATAPRAPQDIIAFFQSALGKYGLSPTSVPAVGGSTALAFSNASTSITLTVTPSGKHSSRYLLFGVLTPHS